MAGGKKKSKGSGKGNGVTGGNTGHRGRKGKTKGRNRSNWTESERLDLASSTLLRYAPPGRVVHSLREEARDTARHYDYYNGAKVEYRRLPVKFIKSEKVYNPSEEVFDLYNQQKDLSKEQEAQEPQRDAHNNVQSEINESVRIVGESVLSTKVLDSESQILREEEPVPETDTRMLNTDANELSNSKHSSQADTEISMGMQNVELTDKQQDVLQIVRGDDEQHVDAEQHIDGGHIDGGQLTINEHIDGEHIDGEHIDGEHIDGEHIDGEHIDGEHIDGEHIDGEHIDGEHIDDEHIDGEHIDGKHIDGEHIDGEHIDGEHINCEQHTDGDVTAPKTQKRDIDPVKQIDLSSEASISSSEVEITQIKESNDGSIESDSDADDEEPVNTHLSEDNSEDSSIVDTSDDESGEISDSDNSFDFEQLKSFASTHLEGDGRDIDFGNDSDDFLYSSFAGYPRGGSDIDISDFLPAELDSDAEIDDIISRLMDDLSDNDGTIGSTMRRQKNADLIFEQFASSQSTKPPLKNTKRTKGKGRKAVTEFYVEDDEIRLSLKEQQLLLKSQQARKRRIRKTLRTQGLLKNNYLDKDTVDLWPKYTSGLSAKEFALEIYLFLSDPKAPAISFPPFDPDSLDGKVQNALTTIGLTFSVLNKRNRFKHLVAFKPVKTSLITFKTDLIIPNTTELNHLTSAQSLKLTDLIKHAGLPKSFYLTRVDMPVPKYRRPFTSGPIPKVGASFSKSFHPREGELVGADAPEIDTENKGRIMLELLGWKAGMSLGSTNMGIKEPIMSTIKRSKWGLGS